MNVLGGLKLSLSARRAWIEILLLRSQYRLDSVALRKESVDRNVKADTRKHFEVMSLSARRAWIEIFMSVYGVLPVSTSLSARRAWIEMPFSGHKIGRELVALRKESVDRNFQYST